MRKLILPVMIVCISVALFGSGLRSTFVDTRDNQRYAYMKFDEAEWMTQNIRYAIPGDTAVHAYLNDQKYVKNGLLYKFTSAQRACPPGWHLPSKREWQTLMNQLPGRKNTLQGRVVAYKQLTDSTAMNIKLAGARFHDGRFFGYGRATMFWTSSDTVWANPEYPQWNGPKYIGYHFYGGVGKDSLNAEPTFANEENKNSSGYCRCVKNR